MDQQLPEKPVDLQQDAFVQSMRRKRNCWDNAAIESFFIRLKVELIYANEYKQVTDVYKDVFEYIEVFYNRIRRHSANEYISPVDYETNFYAQNA
ncbi:MAG: IS3 family transposase [Candidatus Thiodiazotropha sp.]